MKEFRHQARYEEESDPSYIKDNMWWDYISPLINGGLTGIVLGMMIKKIWLLCDDRPWHWSLGNFCWLLIIVVFPLLWFLVFFEKGTGLVDYSEDIKIPNPYMTGISLGYFIVFI